MTVELIKCASLRVRYSETDKMGIVFNSNYLSWFEIARTELCRKLGIAYREWEDRGFMLPVSEAYCRYKRPARYDDVVDLYCRSPLDSILPHSILFEYRAELEDSTVLAHGWTKHAFIGPDGKLCRRDNPFRDWLLEASERSFRA